MRRARPRPLTAQLPGHGRFLGFSGVHQARLGVRGPWVVSRTHWGVQEARSRTSGTTSTRTSPSPQSRPPACFGHTGWTLLDQLLTAPTLLDAEQHSRELTSTEG